MRVPSNQHWRRGVKVFDALDPQLDATRSYFLEASAGTGKTFAIEHLYSRMLDQLDTDVRRILVVTFTRAATRELRSRIRNRLKEASKIRALAQFDEAQIFTIHGFCFEMLRTFPEKGDVSYDLGGLDSGLSMTEMRQIVRDFFRIGLDSYLPSQLERVLNRYGRDPERLITAILQADPVEGPKEKGLDCGFTEEELRDGFDRIWPRYTGLATRSGELKYDVSEEITALVEGDLDRLVRESHLLDRVARGKLKAKAEPPDEPWIHWLRDEVGPLIDDLRDPLGQMAFDVQLMLERVEEERESLSFNGLIDQMVKRLEDPIFLNAVRDRFDAAIVDEFQDTDPKQWQIFWKLFKERPLSLVGDPKQSIYAFRKADIYTYLKARKALGEGARFSLGTNYRSRAGLIDDLNRLFDVPNLIELPQSGEVLDYSPVKAGCDEGGELQFLMGDEAQQIAFICDEIIRLERPFDEIAVLVRDRFQAERFRQVAEGCGIPTKPGRGRPLAESPSFRLLELAYRVALDPSDVGRVRALLASPLFGRSAEELLEAPNVSDAMRMQELHEVLVDRGLYALADALEMRGEALQIAALLGTEAWRKRMTAEQLATLFAEARSVDSLDDQAPKLFPVECGAVEVLTAFGSKGLEWPIVFALGTGCRPTGRRKVNVEQDAEKMRLLYVALTRAKERCYASVVSYKRGGELSPMEKLLEKRDLEGFNVVQLEDNEPKLNVKPALHEKKELVVPDFGRRRIVQSYSSLAPEFHGSGTTVDDFPPGRQTGIVLHSILERLDWHRPWKEWVAQEVEKSHLRGWEERIVAMVDQTLSLDLGGFTLRDVERAKREMEFLYTTKEGAMVGVIDLLFEHAGKTYILDYKSNVDLKMEGYELQSKIYREAIERIVPVEACLYLFLRHGEVIRC